ncbi:probable methyltransferase At1g27930 [Neltuma alba]|uniref:probable methyltransferase At1g27930 n=1 Tax=Neltuma alba TaxID=207710 RepID=UPI0010A575F1|nr:probable methyltransferase At1g27930 [Prosopis alba]
MQYIRKDSSRKRLPPISILIGKPRLTTVLVIGAVAVTFLILYLTRSSSNASLLCYDSSDVPFTEADALIAAEFEKTPSPLVAILHYVTSPVTPQLSLAEARGPFDILLSLAPCNFLIFGSGHDSLMWDSFNPHGTTLFLEEDPKWLRSILRRFPVLDVRIMRYGTRLSDADALLSSYKEDCWGANVTVRLKGNEGCKLALNNMPEEVYSKDWDIILIDGPRGYEASLPGRMAVIYSAAVMARGRKKPGVTHVFVHDVDRKVERTYAKEFLCLKYKVSEVGRLWHFVIPPAINFDDHGFC